MSLSGPESSYNWDPLGIIMHHQSEYFYKAFYYYFEVTKIRRASAWKPFWKITNLSGLSVLAMTQQIPDSFANEDKTWRTSVSIVSLHLQFYWVPLWLFFNAETLKQLMMFVVFIKMTTMAFCMFCENLPFPSELKDRQRRCGWIQTIRPN
jgi:hypothetical protein